MTYLPWLLLAWLTFETLWDLRDRRIPLWFSLVILIPGIIWLGLDSWRTAILIILSLAFTEVRNSNPGLGLTGMFGSAVLIPVVSPAHWPLAAGWWGLMLLWSLGILGGADALAGLSLLLFFPSWKMLVALVAGILTWSLLMLLLRYGRKAGLRLWVVASTRARGTKAAGLGAYALAALFYGLARIRG